MAKLRSPRMKIVATFSLICLISVSKLMVDNLYVIYDKSDAKRSTLETDVLLCLPQNNAIFSTKFQQSFATGLKLCSGLERPITAKYVRPDSKWQQNNSANSTIVVYSAFYDDRPAAGLSSWLRLQGVASLAGKNTKVYCHIWYDACQSPYVTEADSHVAGRSSGYVINGETFIQYVFSCRLPGFEPVPTHVSLVAGDQCANATIYVPIERTVRAEPDHEFGVCVAIAFGSIPTPEFVEWIELNRLLGVTEFSIYDGGMDNMSTVFDYYIKQGVLQVHFMPPPVTETPPSGTSSSLRTAPQISAQMSTKPSVHAIKLSSTASLNDCQMRNMYRYRYVIVIDFDEVIVPRFHDHYTSMIQHIQQKYKVRDPVYQFKFVNTYFFKELEPDSTQPSYLRFMRFRRRAAPSSEELAPKSFVDPRLCLIASNHYCAQPFYGSPATRLAGITVNPGIARSHHYRMCPFKKQTCSNYFKSQTRDDVMLRFIERLRETVELVLTDIDYQYKIA